MPDDANKLRRKIYAELLGEREALESVRIGYTIFERGGVVLVSLKRRGTYLGTFYPLTGKWQFASGKMIKASFADLTRLMVGAYSTLSIKEAYEEIGTSLDDCGGADCLKAAGLK